MNKGNYEVEVLVNGRPVKEYFHEGKTYIEGKKGTTFSLKLRNNSPSRKLFVPSIDGLSVMSGKECSFNSSGYIVQPWSSITVDGWRTSDNEVAQFYFSSPRDSYGSRIGKGKNIGVIGCAIFGEEYHEQFFSTTYVPHNFQSTIGNGTINAYGAASNAQFNCLSMSSVSNNLGTGFGETKRSEVVSVSFERESRPLDVFEIHYNTREQLERLGIEFRPPIYVSPQAFPGEDYCQPPVRR